VLPDFDEQSAPYRAATLPVLADAELAGVQMADAELVWVRIIDEIGAVDQAPDTAALTTLSDALVVELLGPLRSRLEQPIAEGGRSGDDATDAINSAYRELKSRRIEGLVADGVTAAVSLGLRRALPAGTPVRWVVDDTDGPCPDCDDNALAGAVPLGEEFPTGQLAPPAHPGCRCFLGPPAG
jgi:hypothetical protein